MEPKSTMFMHLALPRLLGDLARVEHMAAEMLLHGLRQPSGILAQTGGDARGGDLIIVYDGNAVRLQVVGIAHGFHFFECDDDIRRALADDGRIDLLAPVDLRGDAAAALAHAMDLGHFDVVARLHQAVYQNLRRQDSALTADADKRALFVAFMAQFSFLEMAPFGQTCAQTVQPTHWMGSIWAFLSRMVVPGRRPSGSSCSRCTYPYRPRMADIVLDALDEQAGRRVMIAAGTSEASASCTAFSMAARSCGSTMIMFL